MTRWYQDACDGSESGTNEEIRGMRRFALIEAIGRRPADRPIDRAQAFCQFRSQRDDRSSESIGNDYGRLRQIDRLEFAPHLVAHCRLPIQRQTRKPTSEPPLG
jgi:hypothetical protein